MNFLPGQQQKDIPPSPSPMSHGTQEVGLASLSSPASFDNLPFHLRLLARLGMTPEQIEDWQAGHPGADSDLVSHLIVTGQIDAERYYRLAASALGIRFLPHLPHGCLNLSEDLPLDHLDEVDMVLTPPSLPRHDEHSGLAPSPRQGLIMAPKGSALDQLEDRLREPNELHQRLYLTTPLELKQALRRRHAKRAFSEQVYALKDHLPHLSAHRAFSKPQALAIALALFVFLLMGVSFGGLSLALNILGVMLFLAIGAFRLAAFLFRDQVQQPSFVKDATTEDQYGKARQTTADTPSYWPSYSVLVPLYREAEIVPDLVASLSRLDYPSPRLRILLLVEEDDLETRRAVNDAGLKPPFEFVTIPAAGPRTKPKALNYALAFVRSDLTVIYDAEDRPAPGQLKEAARRMMEGGPELACLQARLAIDNSTSSWLSHHFAIEYASLFDGLLPFLARFGLPIPLGGTSNHFRTAILKKVGGWDPFNVTEDADLGLRLFRFGYRIEMLASDTEEEAPESYEGWLKQRTRWFKGWMKTWMVHMQAPRMLWREMGLVGFLTFQILIGGMLVSALVHPVYIFGFVAAGWAIWTGFADSNTSFWLLLQMDAVNLMFGYGCAILLALHCARRRFGFGWASAVQLPLYWLIMTPAAWRALYQILFDPHRWEKTEHGLSSGRPDLKRQDPMGKC